jgi:hypothetical protein
MGRARMQRPAGTITYHLENRIIRLMKKGMSTATAVQSRGTRTSRIGSFWELQLRALTAAEGINQIRAKLVKSQPPEKTLNMMKNRYTRRGRSTGRLTISTKPLNQRDMPKPPGLTREPRKN